MSDTIVALSTPSGESAIAVIRLSGENLDEFAFEVFGKHLQSRMATYARYVDLSGNVLDDVVAVLFKSPHSYTGEDCLEISTHGNPFIIQSVIGDIINRGVRPAGAGEFTRRAFENGKMDLSQAEAVALLIEARSQRSLRAAQKQLSGELGRRVNAMSERLVETLALIEAYIDFPEDDLPDEDKRAVANAISKCCDDMGSLIETAKFSPLVHQGLDIVIAGAPNAGKSSLLNLLLGSDRAIVSNIAGTTRDFISEKTSIGGNAVNLTDTAGLRGSDDELEAIGIERARQKISNCDICLYVVDASADVNCQEFRAQNLTPENTILVLNKCDIVSSYADKIAEEFANFKSVKISCSTGEGIEILKDEIVKLIDEYHITAAADDILVSARHAQSLQFAKDSAMSASSNADNNMPAELTASDLREALNHLGDIVGKTDNEAILDKIFSKFCIGK